jgi:hypothetical protein
LFSTYTTLYGFVEPTSRPRLSCVGVDCMARGSGTRCCEADMGEVAIRGPSRAEILPGAASGC